MSARRVVLDVDPGLDDALALLLAATAPQLDLRGVVATAGNVDVDTAVRNALGVLASAGRPDVPVVRGAGRTRDGAGPRGPSRHGRDGLAGLAATLPAAGRPDPRSVAELLAGLLPGALLVLLAPASSLAVALGERPDVLDGAAGVVTVGGWNAAHDPRAAADVRAATVERGVPFRAVDEAEAAALPLDAVRGLPGELAAGLREAAGSRAVDAAVVAALLPGGPLSAGTA